MTYSPRGIFTKMTPISPAVFVAAPTEVQNAWKAVQEVHVRYDVACEELATITAAVETAAAKDAENAAKAVAANKPIPKSLELQAKEAVHEAQRKVNALEQLADQTESAFVEILRDHADAMTTTFIESADRVMESISAHIADLGNDLADLSTYAGSWAWLANDCQGTDAQARITVTIQGVEQAADVVLGWVTEDVRRQLPSVRAQRIKEQQEAWEAQRRERSTADGLVVDTAAQMAYSR